MHVVTEFEPQRPSASDAEPQHHDAIFELAVAHHLPDDGQAVAVSNNNHGDELARNDGEWPCPQH